MAIHDKVPRQTVLVTGCSGYIGSHLGKKLKFLGLDRDQEVKDLEDFDPRDPQFQEVRQVVHLADLRLQDLNAQNIKSNIRRHEEFLDKLSDLPHLEKVIFSSSCSVYGYAEEWIDERSRVSPTSFYAESKLAVEEFLQRNQLPCLIFRFGTAYGWSENMREDLFVNEVAYAASASRVLDIYALEAWRPYIHCRDFAAVLEEAVAASAPNSSGEIINAVSQNMTKKEILDLDVLRRSSLRYKISEAAEIRNYKVRVRQELVPEPCLMADGLVEMIGRYNDRKK